MKIQNIQAIEVLDSRGKPTVRAFVMLEDGRMTSASVPSGASTGTHEALELRDGDQARHLGAGVLKAVEHVNTVIKDALVGMEVTDPRAVDQKMLELDGTENKEKLGANAMLAVSQAVVRAGALAAGQPLWQFINTYYMSGRQPAFPRLMVNIVNGGKHADWNFDIQEFMIVPTSTMPSESTRVAAEIFHGLQKNLKKRGLAILVGDEGGFSPALNSNEEVLQVITESAEEVGHQNGRDFNFALDSASSEFYENDMYDLKKEGKSLSDDQMIEFYQQLRAKYGIYSFEDPFAEDDWEAFQKFTAQSNGEYLVVGDDLFVTNQTRLQRGIEMGAGNAILVKVNQIGSVLETIEAVQLAQQNGFKVIISHRSGETEDAFIADLAYGVGADLIKTGSMSRSERLAKYNRLLEIEAGV